MKYWARVESDIVIEVIQAEKKPEFHPDIIIIECDANTQEDDTHSGGVFSRPQASIDDLKDEKITAVNSLFSSKIESGYLFETNTYQIDQAAQADMNAIYTKLADNQLNPHGGVWRDIENDMNAMDDAKVKSFIDAVFSYVFTLKQVLWTHKDNIRAMTRSEDVENYDITTLWP